MAKRPDLSSYQRGIVNRYYEHRDTIALTRLSETVSELFLAQGDPKKTERLWKRVPAELKAAGASEAAVERVLQTRTAEALAEVIQRLG